jgi:4-hydroxybenzoyl-CoA reductase subunit beta
MMRLPKMDHCAPASVAEVVSLLDKHGAEAKVLAGGTDLVPACKLGNVRPALLVSLGGIPELKGIRFQEEKGLTVGAMSSLSDVRYHSSVLRHYPALAEAAAAVGTVQLQYMGTLGGNLCLNTRCVFYNQSDTWRKSREVCFKMGGHLCHVVPKGKRCYAVASADAVPALIALGAEVKLISSSGERIILAKELYTGDGREPMGIRPDELLTEIRIPQPASRQDSTYLKYRLRGAIDFPLVGVAARMDSNDDGICTDCRVVLNAVDSAPVEVPEIADLLKRKALTAELVDQVAEEIVKNAHPVANTAGSTPTYRRKMVGILARRALLRIAHRLGIMKT